MRSGANVFRFCYRPALLLDSRFVPKEILAFDAGFTDSGHLAGLFETG
jgi:hypothetical protein